MMAAATPHEEDDEMRERRCIVTGEVLPESRLIRFAADPGGVVTPDVAAKLPGRGLWVSADRAVLQKAVAKNAFARAAKAPVTAPQDLPARTEAQLVLRMQGDIGLARRAGQLLTGFDTVVRALDGRNPPSVLIEARDGAADGRRKLFAAARARDVAVKVLECLDSQELSVALGKENVIHAALLPGRLAERLVFDAARLEGFRPPKENPGRVGQPKAAPLKGIDERDER